jgi:predicted DNA-binding transcriptional regulator AlpA
MEMRAVTKSKFDFDLGRKKFLKLEEVTKELAELGIDLKKHTIYRMIKAGNFPGPYKMTDRLVAWNVDELQEWINSRVRSNMEPITSPRRRKKKKDF